MFKKMQAGELSLGATLWKYGVLGVAVFTLIVKLFERLLFRQVKGMNLWDYYTGNFSLVTPDTMAILWTLCYAAAILGWIFYTMNVFIGIWRCSGADERSSWLRNITRLFALILVVYAITVIF